MAHNSVGFSDPLTLELDVIGPKANPTRGEPASALVARLSLERLARLLADHADEPHG